MGTHRPFLTQIEPRSTPARAMSEPDSPPPRTPVVAVVGTSDESTASFLSLLVRGDANVDRQMPAPGEVLRWTLDTKYYVADSAKEKEEWINALGKAVVQHSRSLVEDYDAY